MFLGAFLFVYVFNFFIPRLMPGDPFHYASGMTGDDLAVEYSAEQLEQLRAYYGMDQPLLQQFMQSIAKILHGDLGLSIHYKDAVTSVIASRLPWTLSMMGITLLLSLLVGVSLALATLRHRKADTICYGIVSAISEIPSFLIGLILLFFIAAKVSWLPLSGGMTAFAQFSTWGELILDLVTHALLPILALTLVTAPGFYFTARASFLTILRQPYLLQGKARGLSDRRIRWRYIFRNALSPIVAKVFLSVGSVVGGTLLVENVFAYPGLGVVMREAVRFRDYPMIQGVFLLSAGLVIVSMFLADVINARAERRDVQ